MATRRPRIRAVASLPLRKKDLNKEQECEIKNSIAEDNKNSQLQDNSSNDNLATHKNDGVCVQDEKLQRRKLIKPHVNIISKTDKQMSPSEIKIEHIDTQKELESTNVDNVNTESQKTPNISVNDSNNFKFNINTSTNIKRKEAGKQLEGGKICANSLILKLNVKTNSSTTSPRCNQQKSPEKSPVDIKDIPQRRRIVRPTVNMMIANRKNKLNEKNINVNCLSPFVSDKIISPKNKRNLDSVINKLLSPRKPVATPEFVPMTLNNNNTPANDGDIDAPPLNEDCSFDPIIPLPSSSKTNRPKLKPTPRFALRRNSFQGSASEAEELEAPPSPPSVCPVPSASSSTNISSGSIPTPSNIARIRHASTSGFTQQHKPRTSYRYKVGANIPHHARTMKDLIFYNPPNNAIQPKEDESKRDVCQIPPPVEEPIEMESAQAEENDAMPVPQVKLGPNGEIVIDEQSLVIETSEAVRSRQRLQQLSVVWDGGLGGGGKYVRGKRCKEWTHRETLRFYRALHTMGTDFSLMLSLFPGRTRKDLKVKFKKEERQNGHLVDKVLMNPLQFNMDELEQAAVLDMKEEEKEKELLKEAANKEKDTQATKKRKFKPGISVAAQSIGEHSLAIQNAHKKLKMTNKQLQSDYIALETPVLPSPARSLLPRHLEQGSLVLLQEKEGLKAYLAGGKTLKPVPLSQDELQRIKLKLEQQNVHYQTP